MNSSKREPLEIELLVPAHARRISVNEHQAFRESYASKGEIEEIDILIEDLRAAEFEGRASQ